MICPLRSTATLGRLRFDPSTRRREEVVSSTGHDTEDAMATKRASRKRNIVIGSAGLSAVDIADGYVGTICVVVDGCEAINRVQFHDTHVTRHQLEELRKRIDSFLKLLDTREESHRAG
jgi:hypothetical protein